MWQAENAPNTVPVPECHPQCATLQCNPHCAPYSASHIVPYPKDQKRTCFATYKKLLLSCTSKWTMINVYESIVISIHHKLGKTRFWWVRFFTYGKSATRELRDSCLTRNIARLCFTQGKYSVCCPGPIS